jgi:hypothetical protein
MFVGGHGPVTKPDDVRLKEVTAFLKLWLTPSADEVEVSDSFSNTTRCFQIGLADSRAFLARICP